MEATKLRAGSARKAVLTVLDGGLSSSHCPAAPTYFGLRRAAEIVEGAAYELAGHESPMFISRLIEIAAELDRHANADRTDKPVAATS